MIYDRHLLLNARSRHVCKPEQICIVDIVGKPSELRKKIKKYPYKKENSAKYEYPLTRCYHLVFTPQIHDNARLLELPSEREAHVRRAGGESRSDTFGDGQPGVRGLRIAAVGHAADQPGIVRRERFGQFRRVTVLALARTRVSSPDRT